MEILKQSLDAYFHRPTKEEKIDKSLLRVPLLSGFESLFTGASQPIEVGALLHWPRAWKIDGIQIYLLSQGFIQEIKSVADF